mgnify:FL=1
MLKKLFGWEMRFTYKPYGITCVVFAALTIVLPLFFGKHPSRLSASFLVFVFGICVGLILMATFVFMLQGYRNSLRTPEGSLFFTVPARTSTVLLATVLVAFVWLIVVFVLLLSASFVNAHAPVGTSLQEIQAACWGHANVLIPLLLGTLLAMITFIVLLYFCITSAHFSFWRKVGGLIGILAFCGVCAGEIFILVYFEMNMANLGQYLNRAHTQPLVTMNQFFTGTALWVPVILMAVILGLLFWGTCQLLEKTTARR